MKSLKSAFVLPTFTLSMMVCGIIANSSFAQPDSAADGYAGATSYEEPDAPVGFDTKYESELIIGTHQLITASLRSGEGYFSSDGSQLIFQSEVPGNNPFYQIFVQDLETGDSSLVSPGVGLTTCPWIHPSLDLVMFSSTHEDPQALAKQAEEIRIRESGIDRPYGWDYDSHYDIYQANSDGTGLVNLTNTEGYDAEVSY